MPDPRAKPVAASDRSASDEASKLELYLQRQLEEDIARIFDESIYSDLEVVCGKFKILTHSCILKARTNIFYSKLEAILHVNIGRENFDEIYSFISDAYTECDIKNQENEILIFLERKIFTKSSVSDCNKKKENTDDIDVFLTPNCRSPYKDNKYQQISCLSPSTEITKEYYALVHIEGNLLEQELIEQDALSNAFHTIIQSQDRESRKGIHRNKPTSLSLISSHSCKTTKHSNNCDIHSNLSNENVNLKDFEKKSNQSKTNLSTCQSYKFLENNLSKTFTNDTFADNILDPTYSPDSLITDDPSSSSDYLSAAYACSPPLGSSGCLHQFNVGENSTKMENLFTSSDSGLENTGMLESLNSHKDVTLTDISLTESTLHDYTTEETNQSQETISGSEADCNQPQRMRGHSGPSTLNGISGVEGYQRQRNVSVGLQNDVTYCNSSKEEKQRQNEEIVILESSSVSSETGSWESVFPPKITDKEICDKFIQRERQYNYGTIKEKTNTREPNLNFEKLFIKHPAPCFIDAASLADEEQVSVHSQNVNEIATDTSKSDLMPTPSKPVPCSTVNKLDISPGDWSESNDNEDSLEQVDNKDTDSIQKDLSPTIFEMTPLTEDSLSANIIPDNKSSIQTHSTSSRTNEKTSSAVYMGTTPHNSIMLLKTSLKQYESEESENDTIISRGSYSNFRSGRYNESSPIVSGGTSIEDVHTPKLGIQNSSPLIRRKIDNTPIVTGASFPNEDNDSRPKTPKPVSSVTTWIVDMSNPKGIESEKLTSNFVCKKPGDRNCENLKNETKSSSNDNYCKSRSSVDSDSSEKSGHKFYIDLSSLPDPLTLEKPVPNDNSNEKKNIFSMYIDLGESSTLKEMPSRLSSSLGSKKQVNENKNSSKPKSPKSVSNEKNISISSKPHDYTMSFERYESLCNDPSLSISEIISIPEPPICTKSHEFCETESNKVEKPSLRRMNGDKSFMMKTVNVIHEETINAKDQPVDLFVKLSDLDKPTIKSDIFEREIFDPRMTRSIPDNNWPEQNVQTASSRSSEVISSFHSENALSLNRLFPHLKNEFSRSMPISLSGRTRSPLRSGVSSSVGEIDEHASDVSEISSIQSSMCRSVIENSTTEETSQTSSLIGNCQSRLGQDLLRMFLEEIAPDVIVEVSGKRIKAHKCILSSRCQYFAGILSGGWVESAGNVIVLPPFSFNVVHFALCHIYSGLSTIPDSISIVELATIADMLGLEGLKEAIMFTLKAKYCHHFHRPCQVCTAGVLECFPLSSVYGLDDLYRKCLRWITKYFSKVWPTKAFATLPKELLDKCYQEHIINLTIENLIDTVYGCGITVASLQNSRWAESVARMCRRLVNAAAHFAAPRLSAVLQAVASAPEASQPAKQALDDCLAAAVEWAPPDETCRAYAFLSNLVKEIRSQHSAKPDLITNGNQISKVPEPSNLLFTHASSWRLQCEGALVRAAPRVVGTQAFKDLPSELRRRLRELGCIMYGPQAIPLATCPTIPPDRKSKSAYDNKPNKTVNTSATRSLDMEKVRNSFVPYKPKPVTVMGSKDKLTSNSELRDIKKTNKVTAPKVRTTKAQEERAKFNQSKSLTSQDRIVNNKSVAARPHLFENTKPRYLEPRLVKDKEKKAPPKSFVNKLVSSSESSRNSSPVQCRTTRASRMAANQKCQHKEHAMSQDSLATASRPHTAEPSTDSLSESQNSNRYATYTKTKHTSKGSVESVISKCQGLSPSSLLNANVKTKIPVYLNQNSISANGSTTKQASNVRMLHVNTHANAKGKTKSCDRKISGSLMNATKSSSAKIVPKVSKETQMCHSQNHKQKQSKTGTKHTTRLEDSERELHIPAMERSGTFLKDEPTFGDKTTNIDKAL